MKIFCSILLSGVILSVESVSIPDIVSITNRFKKSDSSTEEDKTKIDELCYDDVGCLSMTNEWKYITLELPTPSSPGDIPIDVELFTRNNRTNGYKITVYPKAELGSAPFVSKNPIYFVFHEFYRRDQEKFLVELKDAILGSVDANVFMVDWEASESEKHYMQALSDSRLVAKILSKFLTYLHAQYAVKPENVHVIGHGFGSHTASLFCKDFNKIGRLTALDPSAAFMEELSPVARLTKDDASFVDVIHTNPKPRLEMTGQPLTEPLGDVDFYMNGGLFQPGCERKNITSTISGPVVNPVKNSTRKNFPSMRCTHYRAVNYFAESIKSSDICKFWGHKVTYDELATAAASHYNNLDYLNYYTEKPCTTDTCIPMGLNTKEYAARGVFVVKTGSISPFCLPEKGIPK